MSGEDSAQFSDFLKVANHLFEVQQASPDLLLEEGERIGVGRRKVYYLLELREKLQRIPAQPEQLVRIGWTKLQVIADHLTPENFRELLELAETNPIHALRSYTPGETLPVEKRFLGFSLTPEQYDIVRKVLLDHGADENAKGLRNKEAALVAALKRLPARPPKTKAKRLHRVKKRV